MPLFHCAPIKLGAGSIIEPGNWGRLHNFHNWANPQCVARDFAELALDYARKTINPELPSRLNCVFCFDDQNYARNYMAQCAPMSVLHQVEPVERDGLFPSQFRANYNLIWVYEKNEQPPLKALETNIQRYWQGNPDTDVEVLVGGAVRVLQPL